MNYILDSSPEGETKHTSLNFIKEFLKQDPVYWKTGSGDSSLLVIPNECLIFFKLPGGIFIQHLPSVTSPLIKKNKTAIPLTHYVGGDPMEVPDVCLCTETTAFQIFSYYIKNAGKLHPGYSWVDIYDYIAYRE
jgi:hypothetical protein